MESELPDGPWSRSEQNRAPKELQAANPQTEFSMEAQSKSALPSRTQQTASPSAPPHRPGGQGHPPSLRRTQVPPGTVCFLWQIPSPLRQPPGWPHLPSTPAGVPWRAPLACQRCSGGLEGDRRWRAVLREVPELPPKVSGQLPWKPRPPGFCLSEGDGSSPKEEAISKPSAPQASLLPRPWPGH